MCAEACSVNLRRGVLHVPRLEGVIVLAVEQLGGLRVQVAVGHLVPAAKEAKYVSLAGRASRRGGVVQYATHFPWLKLPLFFSEPSWGTKVCSSVAGSSCKRTEAKGVRTRQVRSVGSYGERAAHGALGVKHTLLTTPPLVAMMPGLAV